MKKQSPYIIIALLVGIFFYVKPAHAQETNERTIALWIYNIAYGIEWENEADFTEFSIGVYNSKKVFAELTKLAQERQIKNIPVKVYSYRRYKDIKDVNILFVDKKENGYLDVIHNMIKGKNTLLITDQAKRMTNSMINFLPANESNKRFEINDVNAETQKFTISKTLLKLGGTKSALRELNSETERELQVEKEKLEVKKKELLEQTALLDEQQAKIEQQRSEIKEKERLIIIKEDEVKRQNKRLDSMSAEIDVQRQKLNKNLSVLTEQEERISEQQSIFDKQSKAMADADKELQKKQDELKKIDEKLEESVVTIENQKDENDMLYGMLGVIALLSIITITGYIKKRKVNRTLNAQNISINKQKEEIQNQAKQLELINGELEKLSIVASRTDNAVTIMDSEGNFEWVNAGFTRLYGYTLQLYKHEVDGNILKASTNTEIKSLIEKCIANKESVVYEALNKTREGGMIWVQTTLTPTFDEEGNVSRLIAIDTDINTAKLAEKEIRAQHKMIVEQARVLERQNVELEKLSLVASETDNAILMTDANGDFIWVNDAYTRMFGFTYEDLTQNISKNIIGIKTLPEIKNYIQKAKNELRSVDYEFQAATKSGHKVWIHTTLTPITDDKGKLKHLIAIDTDITNLKKAEFEIRQKSEELLAQSEELRQQNEHIELANSHIRSSITYAKTIQQAILPLQKEMDKFFESFVIFKPKDIVSGDFYWFAHLPAKGEYTEKIFVATVDCTGHGVPGAFMSMIANQMLKEIVLEKKIVKPKEILEQLDAKVKKALRQNESINNDGMDLVLCRIEKKDNKYRVKFSGAKRPLYYFGQNEDEVMQTRGDRRSIGGSAMKYTKVAFTDQEHIFENGDQIWLGTDGFIDQNDASRRRLGTPKLLKILNEVKDHTLNEQKNRLEAKLQEYQGKADQRDDITLIGINFDGRW